MPEESAVPKRSVGFWLVAVISALIAGFCLYLVYLSVVVSDTSAGHWLFVAFATLFLVVPLFAVVELLARPFPVFARLRQRLAGKPEAPRVAFAPHWQMMTAIIVMFLVAAGAILAAVVRFFL